MLSPSLVQGQWIHFERLKRREFITLLGGAAAAWPLAVPAQQAALPVVGVVGGGGDTSTRYVTAFRKGLSESGIIEENVTIEYHGLEGHYDRLPALMADPVPPKPEYAITANSYLPVEWLRPAW